MSWLGKINLTEMGNRAAIGATQSISQVFFGKDCLTKNYEKCWALSYLKMSKKVNFESLGLDYDHLNSPKKEEEKSGKYF